MMYPPAAFAAVVVVFVGDFAEIEMCPTVAVADAVSAAVVDSKAAAVVVVAGSVEEDDEVVGSPEIDVIDIISSKIDLPSIECQCQIVIRHPRFRRVQVEFDSPFWREERIDGQTDK